MAKTTTNYGFTKPEKSDNYSVDVMGDNMDKIDAKLKEINNAATSGTITKATITATDKFVGTLYGKVYVNAKTSTTKYNNDITYATRAAQSLTLAGSGNSETVTSNTLTVTNYSKISMSYPYQLYPGIYIPSSSYFTDSVPSTHNITLTFKGTFSGPASHSTDDYGYMYLYVNSTKVYSSSKIGSSSGAKFQNGQVLFTTTYTVKPGDKVYCQMSNKLSDNGYFYANISIPASSTYYINTV